MTLIAALESDNYPMVLGDLVISRKDATIPNISVPTRSDLSGLVPEDWSIVNLKRKIGRLNDRLAYAWAGSRVAAAEVTKELKGRIGGSDNIDMNSLSDLMSSSKNWGQVDCTLIGWLVDGQDRTSFKFDFRSREISLSRHPYIEGTGANDFYRYMTAGTMEASRTADPAYSAIGKALGHAAGILGREVLWGRSLQSLYGGGMEVLILQDNVFRELDDVAYLFWDVDNANDREVDVRHQPIIMRYKYLDDILVIESNRPEKVQTGVGGALLRNRLECFIALPVHMDELPVGSTLEYPLTNPSYLCNFVHVLIPDTGRMYLCFIFPNDIEKGMMEFRLAPEGGEDQLELSEKFFPFLGRQVHRRIEDYRSGRISRTES